MAATTPSLAPNASVGFVSLILVDNNCHGCCHPLTRSKREWGVPVLISRRQRPPQPPPPPHSLQTRVGGSCSYFSSTTTATAATSPSLTPNTSGGGSCLLLATNTPRRIKDEWGARLHHYIRGLTLHVAPTTRSGIGCYYHPLPCSKSEWRGFSLRSWQLQAPPPPSLSFWATTATTTTSLSPNASRGLVSSSWCRRRFSPPLLPDWPTPEMSPHLRATARRLYPYPSPDDDDNGRVVPSS